MKGFAESISRRGRVKPLLSFGTISLNHVLGHDFKVKESLDKHSVARVSYILHGRNTNSIVGLGELGSKVISANVIYVMSVVSKANRMASTGRALFCKIHVQSHGVGSDYGHVQRLSLSA